ncbi:MAG TPA: ribosome maturation factor RimM [Bacillota bacterium]|nr:ribosome maturation factor RimM [Bacillota bacterium]
MSEEKRFQIGKITGTHGLKGEIKVFPLTDFPERFDQTKQMLAQSANGKEIWLHPLAARLHKGFILLKVAEFQDINEVIPWLQAVLTVSESELMPLPEGRYYIYQILGMDVYQDDGLHLGKVTEVLSPGSNDVYVVELSEEGRTLATEEQTELLLPVIDEVILSTDLLGRRITVKLLTGLL